MSWTERGTLTYELSFVERCIQIETKHGSHRSLSWWWAHRSGSRGSVESAGHSAFSWGQPVPTWRCSLAVGSRMIPHYKRICGGKILDLSGHTDFFFKQILHKHVHSSYMTWLNFFLLFWLSIGIKRGLNLILFNLRVLTLWPKVHRDNSVIKQWHSCTFMCLFGNNVSRCWWRTINIQMI